MWSRRRSPRRSELEDALREHRAEPSAEFVDGLARRVAADRPSPRRAWSRVAFASALSVFILGTFASFGGLGYAASGASDTYSAVKQVVVKHKLAVSVTSSAQSQYPPKPKKPSGVKAVKKTVKAPSAVAPAQAGTLPFTGFSLLATLVVSLALIAGGLILRRRERRS